MLSGLHLHSHAGSCPQHASQLHQQACRPIGRRSRSQPAAPCGCNRRLACSSARPDQLAASAAPPGGRLGHGLLSNATPLLVPSGTRPAAHSLRHRRSAPAVSASAVALEERPTQQQGLRETTTSSDEEVLRLQLVTEQLKDVMADLKSYMKDDTSPHGNDFLSEEDYARLETMRRRESGGGMCSDEDRDSKLDCSAGSDRLTADSSADAAPVASTSQPAVVAASRRRQGATRARSSARAAVVQQSAVSLPTGPELDFSAAISESADSPSSVDASTPEVNARMRTTARRSRSVRWGKLSAEQQASLSPKQQMLGDTLLAQGTPANSSADIMRQFMKRAGSFKLLSAEEEMELSQHIQKSAGLKQSQADLIEELGREPTEQECAARCQLSVKEYRRALVQGQTALQHLIDCNLRLVVSIARKYSNKGTTVEDMIAEGTAGLMRAAQRFDATRGFKFSTYAHWWIRQSVSRCTNDQSRVIRLPVHIQDIVWKMDRAEKMLFTKLGRAPSADEVAEDLGITVDRLTFLHKTTKSPTSSQTLLGNDAEGDTLEDTIADTSQQNVTAKAQMRCLESDVDNVLHTLSPRECGVLRMRYGLDDGVEKTLEEIGKRFKVTRERIRQIESKAIRKMRQPTRQGALKEYHDAADALLLEELPERGGLRRH